MSTTAIKPSKAGRLGAHILTSLGSFSVVALTAFLVTPVIIHALGNARYGIWSLFGDMIGYYSLLDVGLVGAVSHYVARYLGQDDHEAVKRSLSTAFRVLGCAAGLILGISAVIIAAFPHIFKTNGVDVGEIRIALSIFTTAVAAGLPMAVFSASLVGRRQMHVVNATDMTIRIATACITWTLLKHGSGMITLAVIVASGRCVNWLALIAISRKIGAELPSLFLFSRPELKILASYGAKNAFINIATLIIYRTDSLVVGMFLGVQWVTYFAVGGMLVSYCSDACSAVTRSFTPHFTHLHAAGQHDELNRLYLLGTRVAGLVVAIGAAGLLAFGKPFLSIWLGPAYVTGQLTYRSDVVMLILLAANVPRMLQSISWQLLFASRRQNFLMWLSVGEAVANFGLSVLLVHRLGLMGVALGTAIPMLVTHILCLPAYVLRKFAIPPREYFMVGLARPVAVGMVMYLAAALMVWWHPPAAWFWFSLEVTASLAVGGLMTFCFGVTRPERQELLRRAGLVV